jgi:hypothetical protein
MHVSFFFEKVRRWWSEYLQTSKCANFQEQISGLDFFQASKEHRKTIPVLFGTIWWWSYVMY